MSIVLIKSKGGDGAIRIDMKRIKRSRGCPNLASLGLATAINSSKRSPCTNAPAICPLSPCSDIVWKYNLENHFRKVHPTADITNYESHYALAEGKEAALKPISMDKKRKSNKKHINFKISPQHSPESALG
jgi:hypothetical protein